MMNGCPDCDEPLLVRRGVIPLTATRYCKSCLWCEVADGGRQEDAVRDWVARNVRNDGDPFLVLRKFQERKDMFIQHPHVESVENFLVGFRSAMGTEQGSWWDAQEKRGWEKTSVGPVSQMRKKGMSNEEIMDELIEIEIESLR